MMLGGGVGSDMEGAMRIIEARLGVGDRIEWEWCLGGQLGLVRG